MAHLHTRRLRHAAPDAYNRFDTDAVDLPADLQLTYIHDRADCWAAIDEVRRLATHSDSRVRPTETEGFGHSRILSADLTLDTVLDAITSESVAELPGEAGGWVHLGDVTQAVAVSSRAQERAQTVLACE